jgi:ParB family transcriptional regulator, chromosome partitioning protein
VKKGLSVRQTERLVQRLLAEKTQGKTAAPAPDNVHVERDLAAQIGYRVKLSSTPRGDGSLTIWFNDLFQLDDLITRLTTANEVRTAEED